MKTLKQIQEENRKFIITACNPEAKTYEEALEMEMGLGCIINTHLPSRGYVMPEYSELTIINEFSKYDDKFVFEPIEAKLMRVVSSGKRQNDKDIIMGKPLTLNKVLLSLLQFKLGNLNLYDDDDGIMKVFIRIDTPFTYEGGFYWDLTKETLEEQLEETQRAVHKLNTK